MRVKFHEKLGQSVSKFTAGERVTIPVVAHFRRVIPARVAAAREESRIL